jgi:transcriptional regulator with XRE-family HTH domain
MSIGSRIKQRRSELKLSQSELAKRCGMSQATLSDLETNPTVRTREVARIAAILGVSALWLSEERGPMIVEGTPHLLHPDIPADVLRLAERLLLLPDEKLRAVSVLLGIKLD